MTTSKKPRSTKPAAKSQTFTDDERAAMKERAKEQKTARPTRRALRQG